MTGANGKCVIVVGVYLLYAFLGIIWMGFVTPYYVKHINVHIPVLGILFGLFSWIIYFILT